MTDVEVLKNKRKQVKAKLTRFRNYLASNTDGFNVDNIEELRLRLDNIVGILDEFNDLQDQIELLAPSASDDDDRSQFECSYFKSVSESKQICAKFEKFNSSESVHSVHSSTSNANSNNLVKLPTIKLPNFEGDHCDWLEFRDCFKALVDENPNLTDIQRFFYLRSSLGKGPAQVIKSLDVSSDNYKNAWNLLHERYENKGLMIHTHIKSIFEQSSISRESQSELRDLFDNVTKHLRSLESLGENTSSWDRLIIYILTSKFDRITRRDWESYKYSGELPNMIDMNQFLKERCDVLERIETSKSHINMNMNQPKSKGKVSSSLGIISNVFKCYFCQEDHSIYKCTKLLALPVENRITKIKELKLCLNCLKPNHLTWKCRSKKCIKCNKNHNSLLHKNAEVVSNRENSIISRNIDASGVAGSSGEREGNNSDTLMTIGACCETNNYSSRSSSGEILLSTAMIKVVVKGKEYTARALLDSGSQSNFITVDFCEKIGLDKVPINHTVKGVGQNALNINFQTKLYISSLYDNFTTKIDCLLLTKITDRLPRMTFNKNYIKLPKNIQLADPSFNISNNIDILLGSDVFWRIIDSGQHILGDLAPILQNTKLGWIVAGNVISSIKSKESSSYLALEENLFINDLVSRFWEIEELTKQGIASAEERYCEEYFIQNLRRDVDNRMIVKIPFKQNLSELGNSREIAILRFSALEKRLDRNSHLKDNYIQFMRDYRELNHMTEIADVPEKHNEGYYLPHHAIIKNTSITTKCRVVFDASCKTDTGLSLNDVQYVGPALQNDIFDILLRFRKFKYVMAADISKMFRQILIDPDQRRYQKIFWRENRNEELKCYQLNTVTYGTASAPYLSGRSLRQLSIDNKIKLPEASKIIADDFFVDDLLTGSDSEEHLLKIQKDVTDILSRSRLELRKWMCNDSSILKKFAVNEYLENNILDIGEYENNKTLGVYWNALSDTIQYFVASENQFIKVNTKRSILSAICQIYDPLGLISPVILVGKILMQELWKLKVSWDAPVPKHVEDIWSDLTLNINSINMLRIPRHCITFEYELIELHGFSDASERAYGACVYIRSYRPDKGYSSNLLSAKSRVAPLKQITLPKLELCAAVLLANLTKRVVDALNISFNRIYLWTDSTITLAWIKGEPTRWKTFVGNRVSEIQGLTNINDWRHVASANNPADIASRGISPKDLLSHQLWWQGPPFLLENSDEWIENIDNFELNVPEQRNNSVNFLLTESLDVINNLIENFSSFSKIQRTLAYVLRFISNSRSRIDRTYGPLQPTELDNALNMLIRTVQMQCFHKEYSYLKEGKPLPRKSSIICLNPFMHEGIIRVGGRLQHSNKTFHQRHPMILPKGHKLTSLIIRYEHIRLMHCGAQQLLYSLRDRFWPVSARNICKNIVRTCVICFKTKPTQNEYLMGALPEYRVNEYLPFINVGVDYGGPFLIKDRKGRGNKLIKIYICLFICMSSKAIHLEPVTDLTTEAFIATFRRFIARRGRPYNIFSDNGKNFVGARRELNQLYEFLSQNVETINQELGKESICWHFIPPRSPAFGGVWEAGIKSCKHHLKRVIGGAKVTFEDFLTILNQIEGILNSRPLTPLSLDPDDLTALTPAHFLIGRSITSLPEGDLSGIPVNRLDRFQRLQSILQQFWSRWSKEYLAELQTRVKWKRDHRSLLKVGVLVLIKNENLPATRWQIGRVVAIHPGSEGVVRVVDVKTSNGVFRRAANKLCVLPIE